VSPEVLRVSAAEEDTGTKVLISGSRLCGVLKTVQARHQLSTDGQRNWDLGIASGSVGAKLQVLLADLVVAGVVIEWG
jgi:hypothetical protein